MVKQINSIIPLWWALPFLNNNIRVHDTTFICSYGTVIRQYIQLLIRLTSIYYSLLAGTFILFYFIPYIILLLRLYSAFIKFNFDKLIENSFLWSLHTIYLSIISNCCVGFNIKNNILFEDQLVLFPFSS